MKINIIKNIKLRDYKNYKLIYKYNLFKKCLNNNSFILFVYKNISKSSDNYFLKKEIKKNDLIILTLKKNSILNLFNNKNFKYLNNIMNNNLTIIFHKNGDIISNKTIENLKNKFNLILVGGLWNKKFYRPVEINKISSLNVSTRKNILVELLRPIQILKSYLSLIKSK